MKAGIKNTLKGLAIVGFMGLQIASASAKIFLGSASLTDGKDTDVITLSPCGPRSDNHFISQIKLEVREYPAEIDNLLITYYNGEKDELFVRDHFAVGSESRWIDLNGAQRCIKKIVVSGDADTFGYNNRKQAKVLFFGN